MSPATVSRRLFLGQTLSAGAFVLGTRFGPVEIFAQSVEAAAPWQAGVYLALDPDGSVSVIAHRSEMGTGIRTSLPMVVAEELDADWSRVRIVQAVGDQKYGSQNTDGSHSVVDFLTPLRQMGATARMMHSRLSWVSLTMPTVFSWSILFSFPLYYPTILPKAIIGMWASAM